MLSWIKRVLLHVIYSIHGYIRKPIYNIYDYFLYPEIRETRKEYGSLNTDKVFYIIRPYTNSNEGLMSLLLNVCRHIIYAEKKGYVPIVDFKNYKTQYSDERNVNIWEDYFEQLSPYSLEEVYQSKNVVLCGLKPTREEVFEPYRRFNDTDITLARSIISRYIRINKTVLTKLQEESIKTNPENCVGLYLRGTDYLTVKPIGHYIQPTVAQAVSYIETQKDKTANHNIYLVTEDGSIYEDLYKEYGDRLIISSFDKFITNYNGEGYLFQSEKMKQIADSKYERGLYYLVKELLLSKCPYIIGGNTCGSWAAIAFSNKTTVFHIFDLGKY